MSAGCQAPSWGHNIYCDAGGSALLLGDGAGVLMAGSAFRASPAQTSIHCVLYGRPRQQLLATAQFSVFEMQVLKLQMHFVYVSLYHHSI